MLLPEKILYIKKSLIPLAGKGLFAKQDIPKGISITEYKGKITTWKKVLQAEQQSGILNRYLFYINRNHLIDAMPYKKALAKYVNDAKGLSKINNLKNNCRYIIEKRKVFIQAMKNIPAGAEILVSYGKEYWDIIKQHNKLSEIQNKRVPK